MDPFNECKRERRTLGDGMDNSLLNLSESNLDNTPLKIKISKDLPATFKPVEPKSQIFNLIPKYVPKERKHPKYLVGKPKEPKFIPYEPYKAAVEPIVPRRFVKKKQPVPMKTSKNNVEILDLVTQMSEMRAQELNKASLDEPHIEEVIISKIQWEKEKLGYENDIKNLRESNSLLENQVKFQVQVNSELKTLLVAAVGEDLESRVQHLTEDKLQLARALLNSADHLTSHQEQTEWLSGQCEVWRSKFLASSLMVEELARWKSALQSRINDVQNIVKNLLEDGHKIQKKALKTYCLLNGVVQKFNNNYDQVEILKSANNCELSTAIWKLSQDISERISIDKDGCDSLFDRYLKLPQQTINERQAIKLLQNPVNISSKQDAICNALMGTAMSVSGEQMYLQHPSAHSACCSHCTGEVKNI